MRCTPYLMSVLVIVFTITFAPRALPLAPPGPLRGPAACAWGRGDVGGPALGGGAGVSGGAVRSHGVRQDGDRHRGEVAESVGEVLGRAAVQQTA